MPLGLKLSSLCLQVSSSLCPYHQYSLNVSLWSTREGTILSIPQLSAWSLPLFTEDIGPWPSNCLNIMLMQNLEKSDIDVDGLPIPLSFDSLASSNSMLYIPFRLSHPLPCHFLHLVNATTFNFIPLTLWLPFSIFQFIPSNNQTPVLQSYQDCQSVGTRPSLQA